MAWLGQRKKKETLDYQASLLEPSWAKERNLADKNKIEDKCELQYHPCTQNEDEV